MSEELFHQILLTILGLGFSGIIGMLGYFSLRLVRQQDENTKMIGENVLQIGKLDVRVQHLEERRS